MVIGFWRGVRPPSLLAATLLPGQAGRTVPLLVEVGDERQTVTVAACTPLILVANTCQNRERRSWRQGALRGSQQVGNLAVVVDGCI